MKLYVPENAIDLYLADEKWSDYFRSTSRTFYAYSGFKEIDTRHEVYGLTADGSSQLFIPYDDTKIKSAGMTLSASDGQEVSTDATVLGSLESSLVEFQGKKGYVYTAPDEFDNNFTNNSYQVNVTNHVSKNGKTLVSPYATIEVYRPGVALVHGLFSNGGDCFAGLKDYLTQEGYYGSQIICVDYQTSNTSSFTYNTNEAKIMENHLTTLYNNMLEDGIVSSKYDLVGHSMGGILSRLYAQKVNKDAVHKIITLDTPHWGSQLADMGEKKIIPILNKIGLLCSGIGMMNLPDPNPRVEYAATVVATVLNGACVFYLSPKRNALRDLATYSDGIKWLNDASTENLKDIPVHAVCSIMEDNNVEEAPNPTYTYDPETGVYSLFVAFNNFVKQTVQTVKSKSKEFSDNLYWEPDHDGAVAYTSQRGGLDETYCTLEYDAFGDKPFGTASNAHHCNTNKWELTYENILYLLQSRTDANLFCKNGFSAPVSYTENERKIKKASLEPEYILAENEDTYIKINETLNSEDGLIEISLDKSEDIVANFVMVNYTEEAISSASNQDKYTFKIPSSSNNVITISVLGRTENNEIVVDSKIIRLNTDMSGDLNEDGVLDVQDVTILVDVIMGKRSDLNGDINNDGVMDVQDVTTLVDIIMGK